MVKWFFKDATGVNNDIERHRKEEAELRRKIANADSDQTRRVYQNFLNLLLQSKAEITDKLGRSK